MTAASPFDLKISRVRKKKKTKKTKGENMKNVNEIQVLDKKVRREACKIQRVKRAGKTQEFTEHFIWDDMSQPNPDIPDNLAFTDMGLQDRFNTWMDGAYDEITLKVGKQEHTVRRKVGAMNDRDFRERCVKHNDRMHALELKGPRDFDPPVHKRIEKIAEWLDCDFIDADMVVQTFDSLELDYKSATRLIFGFTTGKGERKHGLRSLDDRGKLAGVITWLKGIADELPKLDGNTTDEWESVSIYRIDEDTNDIVEDPIYPANPFKTRTLGHPKDGLRDAFLRLIETADRNELNEIQSMVYPKDGNRPELWYLSDAQRSQFWEAVIYRRCQLHEEAKQRLDDKGHVTIELMHRMGTGPRTKALIMAYLNGTFFELDGTVMKFDHKQTKETCWVVWREYKDMQKEEA
jgi:hypothetical protein